MPPQETTQRAIQNPPQASVRAAISLLTDEDAMVVQACQTQLLAWGESVRASLEDACGEGDSRLRAKVEQTLRHLDIADWDAQVTAFAARMPRVGKMPWEMIEEGAMLLSSMGRRRDSIDANQVTATLDGFAAELAPRFRGKSAMTCAKLLTGFLSNQLGYGGSQSSFYESSNVQFDKVVKVRRGVPVSLALLYVLVGRRAGLDVCGVAIPDHFLVRIHGARPVLLDPYHEGRQVTKADCVRYLRLAGYSLHTNSYLEDVNDCQLLDCLLRNLLRVYGYREDNELCSALENARQTLVRA